MRYLEACLQLGSDRLLKVLQHPLRGIQHHQHVRQVIVHAPLPVDGITCADVSQTARAAGIVAHAVQVLIRETLHDVGRHTQRAQAVTGQGHLERRGWQRLGGRGTGDRCCRQPGTSGISILNTQQEKAGVRQVFETEAEQRLHVLVLRHRCAGRRLCIHRSRNQARACASVIVDRSRPVRIR